MPVLLALAAMAAMVDLVSLGGSVFNLFELELLDPLKLSPAAVSFFWVV